MGAARAGKARLDCLLVERGLAETRQRAQAMILAGHVLVNEQKVEKCGAAVAPSARLRILEATLPYVSRGGVKLQAALAHFGVEVQGKVCLDVGASTGGFTDCLLQHGAAQVFAVDVGTNQLAWKLRRDARVVALEKTNARRLEFAQIGRRVERLTMDVSFISATLILPALAPLLEPGAEALILVKPQFELSHNQVGHGGIVRDTALHREAVERVASKLRELGFLELDSVESALPGASGNREYFLHALWKKTD
jgi:23S rRNA (cytidine1920-2'-O)/16S rRNA (cytidine1409-2'-O)-methyltransferase